MTRKRHFFYPSRSFFRSSPATVTIPARQFYVEGSYDPAAFIMLAKSEGETLDFNPQVALFSITPTAFPSGSRG